MILCIVYNTPCVLRSLLHPDYFTRSAVVGSVIGDVIVLDIVIVVCVFAFTM